MLFKATSQDLRAEAFANLDKGRVRGGVRTSLCANPNPNRSRNEEDVLTLPLAEP